MLKEAFQFLTELGHKAGGFHSTKLPSGDTVLLNPDGTSQIYPAKIPDRADAVATLDSLIAWLDARKTELGDGDFLEVFVSENQVAAIIARNQAPTADKVALPLHFSKAWQAMHKWLSNALPQVEVVRLLRGPLFGCCSDGMVGVFRSLEFSSGETSQRKISGPSSDTMGRQAHREALSGGQEIPEQLTLTLPVFDRLGIRDVTVPVAIDVDYDAERIRLLEVRDSVADAHLTAMRAIAAQIESVTDRVYFGAYSQT